MPAGRDHPLTVPDPPPRSAQRGQILEGGRGQFVRPPLRHLFEPAISGPLRGGRKSMVISWAGMTSRYPPRFPFWLSINPRRLNSRNTTGVRPAKSPPHAPAPEGRSARSGTCPPLPIRSSNQARSCGPGGSARAEHHPVVHLADSPDPGETGPGYPRRWPAPGRPGDRALGG